jgi:hypothetical protein
MSVSGPTVPDATVPDATVVGLHQRVVERSAAFA